MVFSLDTTADTKQIKTFIFNYEATSPTITKYETDVLDIGDIRLDDLFGIGKDQDNANGQFFEAFEIQYFHDTIVETEENVMQIFNNMPYFPVEIIGCHYNSTTNHNIEFDDHELIGFNDTTGKLMKSDLGARSFSKFNIVNLPEEIRRVLPLKSFIENEHQNTVAIFTPNGLFRLYADDSSEWNQQLSKNLIGESSNTGIEHINTAMAVFDEAYWLGTNGIMMISPYSKTPKCISDFVFSPELFKNRDWFAFYVPQRDACYFHSPDPMDNLGSNTITIVYQRLFRNFRKFSGLVLHGADYSISNGFNIFLKYTSVGAGLFKYPSEVLTSQNTLLETALISNEGKLRKIKLLCSGNPDVEISVNNHRLNSGMITTTILEAENNRDYSLKPGSKGDAFMVKITGAEEIREIDIK